MADRNGGAEDLDSVSLSGQVRDNHNPPPPCARHQEPRLSRVVDYQENLILDKSAKIVQFHLSVATVAPFIISVCSILPFALALPDPCTLLVFLDVPLPHLCGKTAFQVQLARCRLAPFSEPDFAQPQTDRRQHPGP